MSTHTDAVGSVAPSYPDAEPVGPHLVVDGTEWVPGRHPESHRGFADQRGYRESYYRCVVCGAERLTRDDLPAECPGPR